ncbi:MAG: NAD-dependent epimerase/dehydratase family protein, partial [Acidimicrobiales bacterium]
MPIRAYVTGAAGFVGRHLCDHLRSQGDTVLQADRSIDGLDITDADGVRSSISQAHPDVVFHLAGQADVGSSWDSPTETFAVNLNGTLNVLAAARDAGVGRTVAVTSADIYGRVEPAQLPLDESTELRPISPYAASKAAADMACLQAFLGFGQDVVRVRAFNHLGPGQSDNFVASALAKRIAENEITGSAEVKVGNLSARRDFTDVRDVARAYRLIALQATAGEVYNICSGTAHSIQELADRL